jgi:hypothetical protein
MNASDRVRAVLHTGILQRLHRVGVPLDGIDAIRNFIQRIRVPVNHTNGVFLIQLGGHRSAHLSGPGDDDVHGESKYR